MLKKLFLAHFFCVSASLALAAASNTDQPQPARFDLGTITVEAPYWNHPEDITGKPDGETFFETLPATGKTTLSESLDGLMGINLRVSGGSGHIAGLSSGGLSGNKILVIKDGLPVNDPFTGSPDIGDFSTVQFEKAEIWQGNRATLWGSNSIGGTLRLTTRFPDYGRLRLWTDGLGGNGKSMETRIYPGNVKLGIRLTQFNTPGFSAAAAENGNTERDAFELQNGLLSLEGDLNARLRLQMSAESNKSLTELDGFDFVSGLPADNLDFRQKKLGNQFNFGLVNHYNNGELRLTHAFNHTSLTGIDESNPFNEYGLETSRQKQAINRSFNTDDGSFLAEISRTEIRAQNHGLFVNRETDTVACLAGEYNLNHNLKVQGTARHDNPQNHEGVTTGNFSLTKNLKNFELSTAWGQAFRMPALNERYYPAYGDPKLEAEHSTSFGVTATHKIANFAKITVGATRFMVRDLIGTTATTDPAYAWGIKAANLNRAQLLSHYFRLSECK
ncbi:MAG: TonB-dependent receptor, partial [Erysipelotrichia bacterium]|nr:TonB-dependent receptor [Erysipelotrichia bacterium]